jgi:class 3 adenylate cyclase
MEATFCYADLAGFTALTEAHGNEVAADVAVRFVEMVDECLGDGDRLFKTVGDAVLVACAGPDAGVVFVSKLFEVLAAEPSYPRLRAGLHHGTAAVRGEEVFGEGVNLAARVAAEARASQVLATQTVAAAAVRSGIEATKLGDFTLRNIARPVTIFDLDVRATEGDRVEDPVCRMEIERDRAPARLRYHHVDYHFCSLECAGDFARAPERYAFE